MYQKISYQEPINFLLGRTINLSSDKAGRHRPPVAVASLSLRYSVSIPAGSAAAAATTAACIYGFMRLVALLITLLLSCAESKSHEAVNAYMKRETAFTTAVLSTVKALPAGSRVTVLDVGANNGDWSNQTLFRLLPYCRSRLHLSVEMYEPQPWFGGTLQKIISGAAAANASSPGSTSEASSLRVIHTQAAAWSKDGNTTFYVPGGTNKLPRSRTATLMLDHAKQHAETSRLVVRMVDLAPRFPRDANVLLVKIDVEGAEYSLVEHLLSRHALCRVTHLHIEWHRNSAPPTEQEQSKVGGGLRATLEQRLRTECDGGGPSHILHEDYPFFGS